MSKISKVCLITLMALIAVIPVSAQDGLTDEERALLERAFNANEAMDSYSSYVEQIVSFHRVELTLNVDEASYPFNSYSSLEKTSYIIQGSTRNVLSYITAQVEEVDPDGSYAYTLTAEARLVDGALYILVERAPTDGTLPADLPAIPDGWTRIDNLDDWPGLEPLSLDSILSGRDESAPTEDMELLAAMTPAITLEKITWGDGTPADMITITIGADSLLSEAGATLLDIPDSELEAVKNRLSGDSQMSISITLNAEDQVLRTTMQMYLASAGIDATAEDPDLPPGTTYDTVTEMTHITKYSATNGPLEPVAAPGM